MITLTRITGWTLRIFLGLAGTADPGILGLLSLSSNADHLSQHKMLAGLGPLAFRSVETPNEGLP
jgi:hypothetical protein